MPEKRLFPPKRRGKSPFAQTKIKQIDLILLKTLSLCPSSHEQFTLSSQKTRRWRLSRGAAELRPAL